MYFICITLSVNLTKLGEIYSQNIQIRIVVVVVVVTMRNI